MALPNKLPPPKELAARSEGGDVLLLARGGEGLRGVDLLAAAVRAALVLQELQLPGLLVEEVAAGAADGDGHLRDHGAVEAYGQQGRVLPEVHDVDLVGLQLQQRLPVDAHGLVGLAGHEVAGRVQHLLHEEVRAPLVPRHGPLVQRHDLGAAARALAPAVVGLLLGAGLPRHELQRLLRGDVRLRLELHQRQDVEAQEGPDEGVAAVDAAVEVGPQQGVRRHAPVADRQQVVLVAVGLGADGQAGEVDLVLPRRRHPEDLQLVVGHPGELVGAQALGLLGQGVEDVDARDAQRHLPQEVPPGVGLRAAAGAAGARPRLLAHRLVGARGAPQQHGARGAHGEAAGGQDVPEVEGAIEDVLREQRREGLLDVGVDVGVGVVDVRAAAQLPEVVHDLRVLARGLLRALAVHVDGPDHLHGEPPEVGRGVLVAALHHGVVRELLDHLQGQVGPLGLLVGVQRVVEAVVEGQPLRPGQVDLRRVLGVLLAELEGLVPAVRLHVQRDELAHVPQLDDRLLGESVVLVVPEGLHRHLQELLLRVCQLSHHLDEAVQRGDLREDLHGLAVLPGREVHLPGGAQVPVLLRGRRLLEDEALGDGVLRHRHRARLRGLGAARGRGAGGLRAGPLALLGPVLGLVPVPELRVHLHGQVVLLGPAEALRRLAVLALEGHDLRCDELLLLVRKTRPVAILLRDAVQEVDVPHVADPDEGLARDVEPQALQGIQREQAPVCIRDPEARNLVRSLEVLLLDVPVQRRALRHVDRLHRDVVEAEDLGALEADDEALQLLHVRREGPGLDAEHVAAAVGQHVLHLRVPRDAVGVGLLVHEGLRVQVVDEEVGGLVHDGQLLPPAGQVQAAHGRGLLDERHGEGVVHEDLHDVAVLEAHEEALALVRTAHDLDVADERVEVPLPLEDAVEGVELELPLLAEDDVVRRDHQQGADKLLLDLLDVLVVHVQRVVV
mmetsp:Transcript_79571/g.257702  ORF Transcript_79571/g.257702 Transcript_79571/m.257702 type:complete len:955 (-) Transcript_79571:1050-3914(-)